MGPIVYGAIGKMDAYSHASVTKKLARPFKLCPLRPETFRGLLWCVDGSNFRFLVGVDLGEAWSLKCRGIVYGIIGKIQFFPGMGKLSHRDR